MLQLYKDLAGCSMLSGARFEQGRPVTFQSVRDFETNTTRSTEQCEGHSVSVDSDVIVASVSPSGNLKCVIRKSANSNSKTPSYSVEIHSTASKGRASRLLASVSTEGVHGQVLASNGLSSASTSTFSGPLSWNLEETAVVYAAASAPPEYRSFFSTTAPKSSNEISIHGNELQSKSTVSSWRGHEYDEQQHWGEQLSSVQQALLFTVCVQSDLDHPSGPPKLVILPICSWLNGLKLPMSSQMLDSLRTISKIDAPTDASFNDWSFVHPQFTEFGVVCTGPRFP